MKKTKFLKAFVVMAVIATCSLSLVACQGGAAGGGTAATVNGTAIPEDEVTNTIQSVRAQSGLEDEDSWGLFLSANSMTPETVRQQILDSLIEQELVKQGAADLGVSVDSSEVDSYVESMRGNFDSDDAWKQALSEAGFTEESYRSNIETSLLTQAVGTHFEETTTATDEDTITAAESFAQYYDGAKRVSHILFKVDDVTDTAAMDAARATAQDVLDQINSGALEFAAAAEQYSDDSSKANGGDVGWDKATTFVTEFQDAVNTLEVGQVSGLVESQFGIHIITVTDSFVKPEQITSIDQIPEDFRESVTSMAVSTAANTAYTTWLDGLRESADIVINDMPANVPYNIDMSKYTAPESSAEVSTEATAESASAESAEASAESAESGQSAEAASAESAEATGAESGEAASAESEAPSA